MKWWKSGVKKIRVKRGVVTAYAVKKIRNANESMLLSHSETAKHENNMKAAKFTTKLDIYVKKRKPTEIEEVAKVELINILFHCRTSYAICSDRSSCRRARKPFMTEILQKR